MVSPGASRASITHWLAWAPEWGCTLANAQSKSSPGAGDGQALGHVDVLAATVVAPRGIALRVLVGEHRALGFQHRAGDDVLGGDQLDPMLLAMQLVLDAPREHVIGLRQRGAEECRLVRRIVGFGDEFFRCLHGGSPYRGSPSAGKAAVRAARWGGSVPARSARHYIVGTGRLAYRNFRKPPPPPVPPMDIHEYQPSSSCAPTGWHRRPANARSPQRRPSWPPAGSVVPAGWSRPRSSPATAAWPEA